MFVTADLVTLFGFALSVRRYPSIHSELHEVQDTSEGGYMGANYTDNTRKT